MEMRLEWLKQKTLSLLGWGSTVVNETASGDSQPHFGSGGRCKRLSMNVTVCGAATKRVCELAGSGQTKWRHYWHISYRDRAAHKSWMVGKVKGKAVISAYVR